jgi:hypothetical protein
MAQGKWVNIPGKGRRWQQPSGELMMEKPGIGFVQAQLAPVTNFLGGMFKSSGLPAYQMSGPGLQQVRQKNSNELSDPAGREKISKAWGTLQSPGFGYIAGQLPSYQDAQGNLYDAVSGRFMWRTRSKDSSSAPNLGGGSPSERAYQSEKSRVAQLTAQDPELQRYEKARAGAKTQEEMNAARDIGMQIWAAKYGNLAKQVKPGQSGYEAIQGTLNAGSMGAPMEIAFDTSNVLGGKPMPQGLSYGTSAPTQIPGGTPIQGGGFPKDKAAMFERFMQGPAANTPTFQGSPLGNATPVGQLNYGGAVQPLGNAISDDFYKTDKAKQLADLFAQSRSLL